MPESGGVPKIMNDYLQTEYFKVRSNDPDGKRCRNLKLILEDGIKNPNLLTLEERSMLVRLITVKILREIRDTFGVCPAESDDTLPCHCNYYDWAIDALDVDEVKYNKLVEIFKYSGKLRPMFDALQELKS